jgi:hypothetical protein
MSLSALGVRARSLRLLLIRVRSRRADRSLRKPLARQMPARILARPARRMASFACLLSAIGFIVYALFGFQLGVEGYAQDGP